MSRQEILFVNEPGERLDLFLARMIKDLSRARLRRLIVEDHVTVDGFHPKPSTRLKVGQTVRLTVPKAVPINIIPQQIPLTVVYEDEDLIVVDKPAGISTHPGPGHRDRTLINAVLYLCPNLSGIGGEIRPGIIHRLDKNTSGLIVVAKTQTAHTMLSDQFKHRSVKKSYIALVHGKPGQDEAIIDAPIGRDPSNRKRMAVVSVGREAATPYRVAARFTQHTLLTVTPRTGRTHQIRVHLASIGHPLLGDALYGQPDPILDRHFLHANRLEFLLPNSNVHKKFQSELPLQLEEYLNTLQSL